MELSEIPSLTAAGTSWHSRTVPSGREITTEPSWRRPSKPDTGAGCTSSGLEATLLVSDVVLAAGLPSLATSLVAASDGSTTTANWLEQLSKEPIVSRALITTTGFTTAVAADIDESSNDHKEVAGLDGFSCASVLIWSVAAGLEKDWWLGCFISVALFAASIAGSARS